MKAGPPMKRKRFKNDTPLRLPDSGYRGHLQKLDISLFPLIGDFTVEAQDCGKYLGKHIRFTSEKHGRLASFPWWDHAERTLGKMDREQIPCGTKDDPFDDLEQGWQILIWEKDGFVCVMEGNDPLCTEFGSWFRVEKDLYISEWEKQISRFRE